MTEQELLKQELLSMPLHKSINVTKWIFVLRVFGGWIYQFNYPPEEGIDSCVFVPEELNVYTKEA